MPNVRFNLKRKEGNDKQLILLIFRFPGGKLVYSTGENVPVKYWEDKKMRAKNVRQYPSKSLNALLDRLEYHLLDHYRKILSEGEIPTKEALKKFLDTFTHKTSKKKDEVISFINKIIEERSKLIGFTPGTIKHYKSVRNKLVAYQKNKRKELKFKNINLDFFYSYVAFLHETGQNTNTAAKYIKTLKVFLNEALDRGENKFTYFKSSKFSLKYKQTENTYLTLQEIEKLYYFEFDERLERVKDLFVVGCCTGLRYSDLIRINKDHVRLIGTNPILDILTGKTEKRVIIPIHPFLMAILEKYNYELPKITNQKFNAYIKEVCKEAGFTETIFLTKNVENGQKSVAFEKWEAITTHTCRRSFITNLKKKGETDARIKRMTGHTNSKQLDTYDKATLEENAMELANSNFFKVKLKAI